MELQAGPRHANPMGTLHGGIVCDLADAAMGTAMASTLEDDESFTTLDLTANYFKPVWNARLEAVARVVRRTRTLGFIECEVTDESGQHGGEGVLHVHGAARAGGRGAMSAATQAAPSPAVATPSVAPAPVALAPATAAPKKKRTPRLVAGLAAAALLGAGAYSFATAGRESTDDAQVEGRVMNVSPRVCRAGAARARRGQPAA